MLKPITLLTLILLASIVHAQNDPAQLMTALQSGFESGDKKIIKKLFSQSSAEYFGFVDDRTLAAMNPNFDSVVHVTKKGQEIDVTYQDKSGGIRHIPFVKEDDNYKAQFPHYSKSFGHEYISVDSTVYKRRPKAPFTVSGEDDLCALICPMDSTAIWSARKRFKEDPAMACEFLAKKLNKSSVRIFHGRRDLCVNARIERMIQSPSLVSDVPSIDGKILFASLNESSVQSKGGAKTIYQVAIFGLTNSGQSFYLLIDLSDYADNRRAAQEE